MTYFKVDNPEAKSRIDKLVEQIVAESLHYLGYNVKSIVLGGAFARGEGAWKKLNGAVEIISDLDICVNIRRRTKIPGRLAQRLKQLGNETGVDIDFVILPPLVKPLSRSNSTWAYDMLTTSRPIYGPDGHLNLAPVQQENIGFDNAISLFFHRHMEVLYQCSPRDFLSPDESALGRLSLSATGMMFTCLDLFTLYLGSYRSSFYDRAAFVSDRIAELDVPVNKNQFLNDVKKALAFKCELVDRNYLEDGLDFWLSARKYLVSLFEYFLECKYGNRDISKYNKCIYNGNRQGQVYATLNNWAILARLVRMGKLPSPWCLVRGCTFYYWMAAFMLSMALGSKLDNDFLSRAKQLTTTVNLRLKKNKPLTDEETWLMLREELMQAFLRLRVA